jgi:hypothetical protein
MMDEQLIHILPAEQVSSHNSMIWRRRRFQNSQGLDRAEDSTMATELRSYPSRLIRMIVSSSLFQEGETIDINLIVMS